jgi:hypothetical protein
MNTVTIKMLENLNERHSHAIAIFGCAACVKDIQGVLDCLAQVIKNAKFYRWHESPANACRTFCHLCLIDPSLVEVYIGVTFEKLIAMQGDEQ